MNNIIEIKNLKKYFKDTKAVDDLSFAVKEGELFAFLGVNGAGKSTTINIMCSTLSKDSGKVMINGYDIDRHGGKITRDIGVVFQNTVLDKSISVYDNLEHRAALYGIVGNNFKTRIEELATMLDFKDFIKRPVGKLSGGQKRRIDIARALIHSPKILILDEPTTGLDPQTRALLWKVISNLQKSEGLTVFLTTHYMEEVADADYVIILDNGKIAAEGTPLDLKNRYTGDYINLYGISESDAKSLGVHYKAISGGYRLFVKSTGDISSLIASNPSLFSDCEVTKGKMDDVFLAVTGKKLTEEK